MYYDICTPDQIWRKVYPESEIYFVCDATSLYNQIRCSPETSKMMTVALPTSTGTRYFHFKTAGQGCSNSGPAWCAASDEVLRGVVGKDCEKGVDDILCQGSTEEEMIPKMRRLFEAAREGKMTFSKKKIQVGEEVEF